MPATCAASLLLVAAARLGAHHAALGDDVHGAAALDEADVGRGLVVDAAEVHGGERTGRGEDRAAPVLRLDAGVRGDAAELGRRLP